MNRVSVLFSDDCSSNDVIFCAVVLENGCTLFISQPNYKIQLTPYLHVRSFVVIVNSILQLPTPFCFLVILESQTLPTSLYCVTLQLLTD